MGTVMPRESGKGEGFVKMRKKKSAVFEKKEWY